MNEEERERLLRQAAKDKRVFKGLAPVGVALHGENKVRPGMRRLTPAEARGLKKPTNPGGHQITGVFDGIAPLAKRSEMQKTESMANRLWAGVQSGNMMDIEYVMRQMQAEGWKKGAPITYEDVRRVVIEQLKIAAAKLKEKQDRTF